MLSGEGGPDPIDPDIYEPNNSFTAAANLGTTNTLGIGGLTIHASSDLDYLKFTAASTATVGVRIDFWHIQGNLQLTGYNSAQQQIAFSNTSTASNGVESFALNLTAGQTYYLKVNSVAGVSPDYSLSMTPLVAAFDWTMPARFGALRDQWGLPIIPNTSDYAQPNPVTIGFTQYPQFGVRLDASATFVAAPSTTYNWHIVGSLLKRDLSGGPVLNTDLPEGQYTVTLTANGSNGVTLSTTQNVRVKDRLIVAMGDSYGTGEGNPNQPQQFDIFGFPTSGAKWAQSLDASATAAHRRAHRSSYAGIVQAAVDLETADPKSSVTLVFLNHSRAKISHVASASQSSVDPGEPGSDIGQVEQLWPIIGQRQVDALVLSIGGEDAGLIEIAQSLVQLEPGSPNYETSLNAVWAMAAARRNTLINDGFDELLWGLNRGGWRYDNVYITEYADMTRDGSGGTAPQILHDIFPGLEIDQNELNGVRANVLAPLAQALRKFAADHTYEYVTDVASAFNFHGYGDWIRTATDSAIIQGPIVNRITISSEEKAATTGTIHPTGGGLSVYRNRINAGFSQPNLITQYFGLTDNAFLPGATDGFTLVVRNVSLTGTAGASNARIFLSPDNVVDPIFDTGVLDVPIPALAPGETYTVSGTLPAWSDPFRNAANTDYVGAVLDLTNQVAESNESDNLPIGRYQIASIRPERDLLYVAPNMQFSGPQATFGTMNAKLGLDEFIGDYDVDGFSFAAQEGQRIAFDIDSLSPSTLDTYIRVYPLQGTTIATWSLLGANDNGRAPNEPHTQTGESFLEYTFPSAGNYVIVVSHVANAAANPMNLNGRAPGAKGEYSLTIEPADLTPPVVTSAVWDWAGTSQKLKLTFSENVSQTLSASDLVLMNLTTGQQVPSASISLSYDPATNTATFAFASILTDGNYRATLPAGSFADPSGNPLATDFNFNFFSLAGDANHDRIVNLADFNILASFFGQSNGTFSQGDFNYDTVVNLLDFNILASRFGSTVAPEETTSSPFATKQIEVSTNETDELAELLA
jgi:hypothetical protein